MGLIVQCFHSNSLEKGDLKSYSMARNCWISLSLHAKHACAVSNLGHLAR
jgi:hypothetical protein